MATNTPSQNAVGHGYSRTELRIPGLQIELKGDEAEDQALYDQVDYAIGVLKQLFQESFTAREPVPSAAWAVFGDLKSIDKVLEALEDWATNLLWYGRSDWVEAEDWLAEVCRGRSNPEAYPHEKMMGILAASLLIILFH